MPELRDRPFDEGDLDDDPIVLFGRWFEEATAEGAFEPNAVALATASAEGAPSARMVLMKSYDEGGLTFFTNYGSRKAAELDENPRAALLFHWPELGRQVRIEGEIERRVAELAEEHEGREVSVRDDWGGYRLVPAAWEFWQHRPDRLHDRFRFVPDGRGGWTTERLGP